MTELEQKKLKALEIIKNKVVHIKMLQDALSLDIYNLTVNLYHGAEEMGMQLLTQEEFDLLKEIL